MKRINRNITTSLAALALTMAGCSDDFDFRNGDGLTTDQGVVIYVPHVTSEAVTRASEPRLTRSEGEPWDFDGDEGKINNLYLFVYPTTTGGNGEAKVYTLKSTTPGNVSAGVSTDVEAKEGYEGFKLDLPADTYEMYVVANHSFTKDLDEITKSDLLIEKTSSTLDAGNLPMSCWSFSVKSGSVTNSDVSRVEVGPGGGVTITANLKFAVAKVRVTVLNDLKVTDKVSDAVISPIYASSMLIGGQSGKLNSGALTAKGADLTAGGAYFDMPSLYDEDNKAIAIKDVSVDNLSGTPEENEPWAWQSTVYLGESLFNTEKSNKTKLDMKIGSKAITTVDIASENGLERSHFYDVVGTPDGAFNVEIQKWEPVTMALALRGSYFLHLDNTKIEVKAGSPFLIWYETNGELEFVSPTLDGDQNGEPIYEFSYNDEYIYVSLASGVSRKEFEDYLTDDKKTNWGNFLIKAGTIEKYVMVDKITYDEYLNVKEDNVTVDVRVRVGAGSYTGGFNVPIESNITEFTISKATGWDEIENEDYDVKSINLQTGTGQMLSTLASTADSGVTYNAATDTYTVNVAKCCTNGVFNLRIAYNGLNEGRNFWKSTHTLTLKVQGKKANGEYIMYEGDGEEVDYQTVRINVLPNVDKYRIYLYAPEWEHPHIYVYECLQYPNPYTTASGEDRSGMPIGEASNTAALQYSFTGAVAFMGWDEGNNKLSDYDSKTLQNGYYVFGSDWAPGNAKHYYDFDFCAEYRSQIPASLCSPCTTGITRAWPGVVMARELDPTASKHFDYWDGEKTVSNQWTGWWYFDLSGVATPGKALVMFNDTHDYVKNSKRIPEYKDSNEVENPGIALFDFSDRVGYLDATKTTYHRDWDFHPTRELLSGVTEVYAIRGNIFTYGENPDGEWYDQRMTLENGKWVLKNVTIQSGQFGIKRLNKEDDGSWSQSDWWGSGTADITGNKGVQDGNFTLDAGTYTFTLDVSGSKPKLVISEVEPENGTVLDYFKPGNYALTFDGTYSTWGYMGINWGEKTDAKETFSSNWGTNTDNKSVNRFEFTVTKSDHDKTKTYFFCIFNDNSASSWSDSDRERLKPDAFKWNSTTKRWEASSTLH